MAREGEPVNEEYADLPWLGVADDFSQWYAELMDTSPTCPHCLMPEEVSNLRGAAFTAALCYRCKVSFLLPTSEVT